MPAISRLGPSGIPRPAAASFAGKAAIVVQTTFPTSMFMSIIETELGGKVIETELDGEVIETEIKGEVIK